MKEHRFPLWALLAAGLLGVVLGIWWEAEWYLILPSLAVLLVTAGVILGKFSADRFGWRMRSRAATHALHDGGVILVAAAVAWALSIAILYPAYRAYFRELGIPLNVSGIDSTLVLARAGWLLMWVALAVSVTLFVALVVTWLRLRPEDPSSSAFAAIAAAVRSIAPVLVLVLVAVTVAGAFAIRGAAIRLGERVVREGDAPSGFDVGSILDVHTFAAVVSPLTKDDPAGVCSDEWSATIVAEDSAVTWVLLRPVDVTESNFPHTVVVPLSKREYSVIRVRATPKVGSDTPEKPPWPYGAAEEDADPLGCPGIAPSDQDARPQQKQGE